MSSKTETDNGVIYLLTSPSGKQYVGQTWNYKYRMNQYRCGCGHGEIHDAIVEYGWNNFTAEILERDIETQEALDAAEDAFIVSLDTMSPHGYNLRRGGARGKLHIKTKIELSVKQRGDKNSFFGKKHSSETKITIGKKSRAANLGKPKSAEARAKMRASHLGKSPSTEHRKNLSVAGKLYWARKRAASSNTVPLF